MENASHYKHRLQVKKCPLQKYSDFSYVKFVQCPFNSSLSKNFIPSYCAVTRLIDDFSVHILMQIS